jgi:hypothetical protein
VLCAAHGWHLLALSSSQSNTISSMVHHTPLDGVLSLEMNILETSFGVSLNEVVEEHGNENEACEFRQTKVTTFLTFTYVKFAMCL